MIATTDPIAIIPPGIIAVAALLTAISRFRGRRNSQLDDCLDENEDLRGTIARLRRKLRRA